MNKYTIFSIGIGGILLVGLVLISVQDNQTVVNDMTSKPVSTYEISQGSTTIHVAGMVKAADSAMISAATNGVVNQILVVEGERVSIGDVVAIQSTPVANAELAYRNALREQIIIEQAALVSLQEFAYEKASVVARSTEEITYLQTEAIDSQLQADAAAVQTAADGGVTTMLDSLAFIDNNQSLFTDTRREQFREIVNDLYGGLPKQFQSSVGYGVDDSTANTLELLESMRGLGEGELSVVESETLGVIVRGQLQALVTLYTTAESDVLDNNRVTQGGDLYTNYFTNRAQILDSLSALESAQRNLQSNIDNLMQTEVSGDQSVAVTVLDEKLAQIQYDFSQAIQGAADRAAKAAADVAVAESALGVVTAPFGGQVSSVLVEQGEYATAGTPLLTLHGNGARELTTSVPVTVGQYIKIGDPLYRDGQMVGTVDRISPTQQGHSLQVIISLVNDDLPVGVSFAGELSFNPPSAMLVVPRDYVFFGPTSPYVLTEAGEQYQVTIEHDAGHSFLVSFTNTSPQSPLVPSRTVSF
jgi:multidrug efflux pump subunit AcrA (membrane-fusion protein)